MADIYVDSVSGNDSTGTGTDAAPYQTIATAYTNATSGDTIHLSDAGDHSVTTSLDFSAKNLTFTHWAVASSNVSSVHARFMRLD